MKKGILLFAGLLLMSGVAWGQVISDFNTPGTVGNWEIAGDSGPGLDSLRQVPDPSNSSNGVMAVYIGFDSTQWHARFDYGSLGNATYLAPNGAAFLTHWIYLDSAQHIPDSLQIDTYAMPNGTWAWTEGTPTFAVDIPKNVWFPLSFPLSATYAKNPNFDIVNHQIMFGLQFFPHGTTWEGTIYVDNVAFIGAKPDYLGQFDLGQPLGNWEIAGDSGPGLDSLTVVEDPADPTNGVMGVHIGFDSTQWHARFDYGSLGNATYIATDSAQFLTHWVYLDSAQHIPDSLQIDTYAMPNGTWAWTEGTPTFAVDIPKNVWFPLSFPLSATYAKNPNFDIVNHQIMFGLQFFPHGTTWEGTIYVDNVAFIGAKPDYLGQFDLGQPLGNWEIAGDSGPGLDSLTVVEDPADPTNGVMGVHIGFDSTQWHARFDYGSLGNATYIATDSAQFLTHWVYLDSAQHIPDSLQIDTYAMPNGTWAWTEGTPTFAVDIPKNVWFPLSFPLSATYAKNPNFDIVNHQIMFGLQFFPHGTTWEGTIYVDNVSLLSHITSPPPAVWNAADFEDERKAGFHLGPESIGTLSVVLDEATSNASMVLQAAANFGTGSHKLAVLRDSVPMMSGVDSTVTDISLDVYIPAKMPNGADVVFFVSGGQGDSVAATYTVGTTLQRNAWTTLWIQNLDSLNGLGQFDPSKPATIGVQVSYPTDSSTFSGNIWFDNLTIYGEWFPTVLEVRPIDGMAITYELYNNYPNPFNPSTIIRYDVPKQGKVQLQVFDLLGREVATLVNGVETPGRHEVTFNASNLSSGVYFFRMASGNFVKTQKMMLMK